MSRWPVLVVIFFLFADYVGAKNAVPPADSLSISFNRARHDAWFSPDKAHHFMVSAFLTGLSYYTCKQEFGLSIEKTTMASITLPLTFGIVKEVYDGVSAKGTMSLKDLFADIAGIAVGFLIITVSSE